MTCSRLLKTGCNNVVLPILFIVVNNIVQHCWAWISPHSGVTMLNNIVDNYEQYGQHNIVASCFQQPWTSHNFLPCKVENVNTHLANVVLAFSRDWFGSQFLTTYTNKRLFNFLMEFLNNKISTVYSGRNYRFSLHNTFPRRFSAFKIIIVNRREGLETH